MRDNIKKILREDFEWVVNDTVPFLEIGRPLTQTNPKNKYRIYITHGTGEDNATWSDNWINVNENETDYIVRVVKMANTLQNSRDFDDGMYELINMWFNGEKWVLSDQDNQSLEKTIKDEEWDLEDDRGTIEDYIREWLDDELMDMGLREYNSYYQESAPIERFWITYFDEYGVEHQVRVNMDGGQSMRYPWGSWE